MSQKMNRPIQDVSVLSRTYELILWIIPVLDKFPRAQKFLIADRIETLLLEIMELIIEAVYTRNKAVILKKANLKLEITRHMIRLSRDMKFISLKKYAHMSEKLYEIGSEIGGWLKYAQSRRGDA